MALTWTAPEYEHREKTPDWFWALGVIAIAGSIAAIIYKNYLFAIFILIATFLLGYFALRKPEEVEFEINEDGVRIEDEIYPYERIKAFWVDRLHPKPKLLLESDRHFMPIITIPLDNVSEKDVIEALSDHVKKREIQEPLSHKIMDLLGF